LDLIIVPWWVTLFGRLNHLDTEPGTQFYSAWAIPPRQKLGD